MRSTTSKLRYVSSLVAFTLATLDGALAQSVTARLSGADTVRQGERLLLSVTLENVAPEAFALPELVGLTPIGGPNRRSQVTISHGVRRSSATLSYYVVAEQPGVAYVPAVEVPTASGDTLATDPIRVFVTDDPDYVPIDEVPVDRPRARRPPTVKM